MENSLRPHELPEWHRPHPVCTGLRILSGVAALVSLFTLLAIMLATEVKPSAAADIPWVLMLVAVLFPLLNAIGFWLIAAYLEYHTWVGAGEAGCGVGLAAGVLTWGPALGGVGALLS